MIVFVKITKLRASNERPERGFALLKALDFSVSGYEEPLIPSDQSSYRDESDDYEDNIESAIDFHQESSLLSESSTETPSLRESEEIFDELSFEERMLSICTKHSISIQQQKSSLICLIPITHRTYCQNLSKH